MRPIDQKDNKSAYPALMVSPSPMFLIGDRSLNSKKEGVLSPTMSPPTFSNSRIGKSQPYNVVYTPIACDSISYFSLTKVVSNSQRRIHSACSRFNTLALSIWWSRGIALDL
jgi:hypothetical protein